MLREELAQGKKWSKIAKALQGRTENAVKNRFNCLVSKARGAYNMQFFPETAVAARLLQEFQSNL